ncbi:MAG: redoxin domain-containing protein [Proteobacteria bacterium]|nr:redoxin domain-containing protein [Pseudomonadota bacterium]
MGVSIVGISFNTVADNQSWAEGEEFEFEVWSDDDKDLAVYYGAAKDDNAIWCDRVTFLLDEDGTVLLEYVDDIDAGVHPGQVLEDAQKFY